ncbi:hypothetical protein HDE_07357 [Halotydeus destructor]|nr:hypothetical protein HDE_07357 [Halotydeus destructor]
MPYRYIAVILTLALQVNVSRANSIEKWSAECIQQTRKSDQCFRDATIIGADSKRLPRNLSEWDKTVCDQLPGSIKCISDLKVCLKPFPRTMFNVAMRAAKKMSNNIFCGSRAVKLRSLSAIECIKTEPQHEQLFQLSHKMTAIVDFVAVNSSPNDLIPHTCCSYMFSMKQTKETFSEICPNSKELSRLFTDITSSLMEDMIDLTCGQYKQLDVCDSKYPGLSQNFEQIWQNQSTRYKTSFLHPMTEILVKLDSELNL